MSDFSVIFTIQALIHGREKKNHCNYQTDLSKNTVFGEECLVRGGLEQLYSM